MRARLHSFAVAAIAGAMVFGGPAGAQSAPCVAGAAVVGTMMAVGSSLNSPFSATVKTSFEQKLADGNAIHGVTRRRLARDSAGRTMTEMGHMCMLGADGQMHERYSVSVFDPVARTSVSWQVGDDNQPKVAQVFHAPDPVPRTASAPLSAEELAQRQKMLQAARARGAQQQKDYKTEDLGIKDFNGVSAHGTRTTQTIPAGKEGNDLPLVVINENWRAKEMGLTVMAISDDPRRGRTVAEYEELNLGEPDPGLFAPPAGYTVQEQPQNGLVGGAVMGGVAY